MKKPIFALVDCNNFFVSCERAFQPKLTKVPVVVLSNNDGCVISRSKEAKDLGIPMGAAFFEWKKFMDKHGVSYLSSNYKLYGEISSRLMEILRAFTPKMEVYSIDEAFLDFSHIPPEEIEEYAMNIRHTILQWTGIPISIGIGETKTLAKVASYKAKQLNGVFSSLGKREEVLADMPVKEIWGVGRRLAPRLNRMGIHTALDVTKIDPKRFKKAFTITGLRMQQELKGEVCYEVGEGIELPQSLICSRSFKKPRTTYAEVSQAISSFIEKGAQRLRRQGMAARYVTVYLSSSRFHQALYYDASNTVTMPVPTSSSFKLVQGGLKGLDRIYKEGIQFKRGGVLFTGLEPQDKVSPNLFSEEDSPLERKLMNVLDDINRDRIQVFLATSGQSQIVGSDRGFVSPNYLTKWQEILEVRAT